MVAFRLLINALLPDGEALRGKKMLDCGAGGPYCHDSAEEDWCAPYVQRADEFQYAHLTTILRKT